MTTLNIFKSMKNNIFKIAEQSIVNGEKYLIFVCKLQITKN